VQTIARLNDRSLFTDRCLVGGKWIAAETSSAIEVANPRPKIIGSVPNCRRTETGQAIATSLDASGSPTRSRSA
jgi:succinate-semialdehyde dehydrogenase/glutarate-semialdehyde dehydrogenase